MDNDASTQPVLIAIANEIRAKRAARRERRRLRAELAVYTSESDRRDLEAILSRYEPEETEEIRCLMDSSTSSRSFVRALPGGRGGV